MLSRIALSALAFGLAMLVMMQPLSKIAHAQSRASITVYVSPQGNDSWSGRLPSPNGAGDGPFATPARARDAIRKMKASGQLRAPVNVVLRGATYYLDQPLVLTPEDSGSQQAPIIYRAYPGDSSPVLSGGRQITGWKRADLPGLPGVAAGNVWQAEVGPGWNVKELSVNGVAVARAATPATPHWEQWYQGTAVSGDTLSIPAGSFAAAANIRDVDLNVRMGYSINLISPIKEVGAGAQTITVPKPRLFQPRQSYYFRVENTPGGMLQPGNWTVNSPNGKIYLWPPAGVDPNHATIVAARLLNALELRGDERAGKLVRFVGFEGVTFADTSRERVSAPPPSGQRFTLFDPYDVNASAVLVTGAEDCNFDRCRVTNVAGAGIRLHLYTKRVKISNAQIARCGADGISIDDYNPGTHHGIRGVEVNGNTVEYCGQTFWHSGGIRLTMVGDTIVRANKISFLPYAGIMAGGQVSAYFRQLKGNSDYFRWNEIGDVPLTAENVERFVPGNLVIEDNYVHDVMTVAGDGGAIYLWGENHCYIRRNVVSRTLEDASYGIYLDRDTMDTVASDNLVYQCPLKSPSKLGCALLMNTNARNSINNNIFALGNRFIWFNGDRGGNAITRNIFLYGPTIADDQGYRPGAPARKISSSPTIIDYNLYWSTAGAAPVERWISNWRAKGWDQHSTIADPQFVDDSRFDFHLRPGSPALKLGFKPFLN